MQAPCKQRCVEAASGVAFTGFARRGCDNEAGPPSRKASASLDVAEGEVGPVTTGGQS